MFTVLKHFLVLQKPDLLPTWGHHLKRNLFDPSSHHYTFDFFLVLQRAGCRLTNVYFFFSTDMYRHKSSQTLSAAFVAQGGPQYRSILPTLVQFI